MNDCVPINNTKVIKQTLCFEDGYAYLITGTTTTGVSLRSQSSPKPIQWLFEASVILLIFALGWALMRAMAKNRRGGRLIKSQSILIGESGCELIGEPAHIKAQRIYDQYKNTEITHTCLDCGAEGQRVKCEYCGTEYTYG